MVSVVVEFIRFLPPGKPVEKQKEGRADAPVWGINSRLYGILM
jgi:hypothetical protein